MTKHVLPTGAVALGFLAVVSLTTLPASWAAPTRETPVTPEQATKGGHHPSTTKLTKEKEKQLVKEAVEAVEGTKKALDALERNSPKDALANLDSVSSKLHSLLAKDAALKEVPIAVDTVVLAFDGNPKSVEAAAKTARDFITHHQLQDARRILDELSSEIRINITTLPLESYPAMIEKTADSGWENR